MGPGREYPRVPRNASGSGFTQIVRDFCEHSNAIYEELKKFPIYCVLLMKNKYPKFETKIRNSK